MPRVSAEKTLPTILGKFSQNSTCEMRTKSRIHTRHLGAFPATIALKAAKTAGRLKRMRTRRGLQEEPDSVEPARRSQTWLRAESSEALAGINEECLELLTAQSMVRTLQPQPMLCELADLWHSLDAGARRRAAECPYLLVDAGFADARRWRFPGGHAVSESVANVVEGAPFFTAPGSSDVIRRVLQFARELARTNSVAARLWLAMPAHCTQLLAGYTLREIDTAAARHPAWLRPRWSRHVPIWREFLIAARSGDMAAIESARMHGIQLLAGDFQLAARAEH
jgi:hypothetical protein